MCSGKKEVMKVASVEKKVDYRKLTAPCGLDCFNCTLYLANTDPELREKIAQRMNISPEQASCRGCRDENGTIAAINMKEPCNVYKCISRKGFSFCFECSNFPCDYLHPYADMAMQRPHNTKVFNLCLIKKMGLEAWAETKAKSVRETYFKGKLKL
jgi:hypothetical protein